MLPESCTATPVREGDGCSDDDTPDSVCEETSGEALVIVVLVSDVWAETMEWVVEGDEEEEEVGGEENGVDVAAGDEETGPALV